MADYEERASRTPGPHDSDSSRTCADCGASFAFGAEEQRFFESKNLTPPKRCLTCRKARRAERTSGAPRRDDDRRGPPPGAPPRFSDRGSAPSHGGPPRFADRGSAPSHGGPPRFVDRGPDRPPPGRATGTFQGSAGYGGGARRPSSDDRLPPRDDRRPFQRPGFDRPSFDRPSFDRGRGARPSPAPSEHRPTPSPAADAAPRKERPRYDITCQGCGVGAQVPFKPVEGRALYCKPCYLSRKAGGPSPNAHPAPEPGTPTDD